MKGSLITVQAEVTIDNEGHARVVREQITNIGSTAAIWKLAKHVVDIVKERIILLRSLKRHGTIQ